MLVLQQATTQTPTNGFIEICCQNTQHGDFSEGVSCSFFFLVATQGDWLVNLKKVRRPLEDFVTLID
jgi:hypothetical protein